MSDDRSPPSADVDGLLYDWFKHLTSLSLLTLGGALTLTQLAHGQSIKKPILIGVLIVVALSGVLAFSGAEQIVRSRLKGEAVPKRVYHLMRLASFVLAMGVGGILQLFVKAI